jgi:hypothetical protein
MTTTLSATRPIATSDLSYLIRLIGPEETAKLMGPPTPEDLAATAAFAKRLAAMTDDEVRTQWGIYDASLISDIRKLFAR